MPLTRKLLATDSNTDSQVLLIDSSARYIANTDDWQFLFSRSASLNGKDRVLKSAGQFNTTDLSSIKLIAYLYSKDDVGAGSINTCTFNIYRVSDPNWTETYISSFSASALSNNYFFVNVDVANLVGASMDGDTTLMIETVVTRLSDTYRDRIYINHLGVYDSIVRLRQDVEFLDITKLDE